MIDELNLFNFNINQHDWLVKEQGAYDGIHHWRNINYFLYIPSRLFYEEELLQRIGSVRKMEIRIDGSAGIRRIAKG